jgi:hypothetical protein
MSYLAPTVPPSALGGADYHEGVLWMAASVTFVTATLTL